MKVEQLQKMIDESDSIAFFGGAGVSTESGIPDFRSVDGLYSQQYQYPPETILSHTFFMAHTEEFFRFYREKMIKVDAMPNAAHRALVKLEQTKKLKLVVTQNIDGLHQAAGSEAVAELHGSVLRNYCMDCHSFYGVDMIKNTQGIPRCKCGGIIKPDVVLYEEGLDDAVITKAVMAIARADLLLVGGTSLSVYPAAGLLDYYKGNKLVLINKAETTKDSRANLLIREKIGEVFGELNL